MRKMSKLALKLRFQERFQVTYGGQGIVLYPDPVLAQGITGV